MRRHTSAGFTLVEVLVVVLIASIVMVVLASVLGSSFEVLRTGETRAQLNSNARLACDYICDDISSASAIPLSFDRDLNGYPDEDITYGYDTQAFWRVADWDPDDNPFISTGFMISEAWSDRLMLSHDSKMLVAGQNVENRAYTVPKLLRTRPDKRVVEYTSLLRLAIPATNDMPYYLAGEWDRNGDGVLNIADARNSGTASPAVGDGFGEIQGYPDLVPVGPYKETCALIQDLFGYPEDETTVLRVRQIPIASNITRVKYEYLHEVPVYMSRVDGGNVQIAYQSLVDGDIEFIDEDYERTGDMIDMIPLISHWELRPIDVAYNNDYVDPDTGAIYNGIHWQLQDQYPEGQNAGKLDGTHVVPATLTGLGSGITTGSGWSMCEFNHIDSTGDDIADNLTIDRYGFVTTSISGGQTVEGGIAMMRPDMEAIQGSSYYAMSIDPSGIGDMGDADGIPDGDGIPDDPVPGWWLPYLRAVRVTVVTTPRQTIEERREKSGQPGKSGATLYYRLDSPIPYADPNRLEPLVSNKQDYIGSGRDVVISKTVPVEFNYRKELVCDPTYPLSFARRSDYNYFYGWYRMMRDPADPDTVIGAADPVQKLMEKDPIP